MARFRAIAAGAALAALAACASAAPLTPAMNLTLPATEWRADTIIAFDGAELLSVATQLQLGASDADFTELASVRVHLGAGSPAQDTLAIPSPALAAGLSATWTSPDLLIAGVAPFAAYAAALDALRYINVAAGVSDTLGLRTLDFFGTAPGGSEVALVSANFTYVPAARGVARAVLSGDDTAAVAVAGCARAPYLFPNILLRDAAKFNQSDVTFAEARVYFASSTTTDADTLGVDAAASVLCAGDSTTCGSPCGSIWVERTPYSTYGGYLLTLSGVAPVAEYEACLRRVFYKYTGASGTGAATHRVALVARTSTTSTPPALGNATVSVHPTGACDVTCPTSEISVAASTLLAHNVTYNSYCDCGSSLAARTLPYAGLNLSVAGGCDKSEARVLLARATLPLATSAPTEDVLAIADADATAACAGLKLVAFSTASEFGIMMSSAAEDSAAAALAPAVYEACLARVFFSNRLPATSQRSHTRTAKLYVLMQQAHSVQSEVHASIKIYVNTSAPSTCANACAPSVNATGPFPALPVGKNGLPPNILLEHCELIKYKFVDMIEIGYMQPYPGACLCAPGPGMECMVPRITTRDVTQLQRATVAFTTGFIPGEDVLMLTGVHSPRINDSFDNATGVMTLTGVASLYEYEVALRCVHYINRRLSPVIGSGIRSNMSLTTAGMRRWHIEVTDLDGETGSTGQGALRLVPRTQPPAVVSSTPARTYTTSSAHPGGMVTDSLVAISDADSSMLSALELRFLTSSYNPSEDELRCAHDTPAPLVTCYFDAATGILRYSGVASLTLYRTLARSTKYHNRAGSQPSHGRRHVFWIAYDDVTEDASSGYTAGVNIDVIGLPAAVCPIVRTGSTSQVITSSNTPLPVEAFVVVSNSPANNLLFSAKVRFVSGYSIGEDVLLVPIPADVPLTSSFDRTLGELSITGLATADVYSRVLSRVMYNNTRPRTPAVGTRVISIVVTDSDCTTAPQLSYIAVKRDVYDFGCSCAPRLLLSAPVEVTITVATSAAQPFTISPNALAFAGSAAALSAASFNTSNTCPPAYEDLASMHVAAVEVQFRNDEGSVFVPREDRLEVPINPAGDIVAAYDPQNGVLRVAALRGRTVTAQQILTAVAGMKYYNTQGLGAAVGTRRVQIKLFTSDACVSNTLWASVRIVRAESTRIVVGSGAAATSVSATVMLATLGAALLLHLRREE